MASLLFYVACLLLALVQHSAGDLAFDVKPTEITPGQTKFLTVNCSFSFDGTDTLSGIISLIVSRSSQGNLTGNFEELESLNIFSPHDITELSGINATLSGEINGNGESYLAIQWSYPTAKESGIYRCEAHGMDFAGHPTSISQTILVTSDDLDLQEVVDELSSLHHQLDLQSETISTLQTIVKNQSMSIDGLLSVIKEQSETISSQQSLLTTLQEKMNTTVSLILAAPYFNFSNVYNDHVYLLSLHANCNMTEAEELCNNYGGYLAEIDDSNEHQFIKDFLDRNNPLAYVAVSGTQEGHPGKWTYQHSGRSLQYFDWHLNEPNESGKNCLEMRQSDQWQMVDLPCFHSFPNVNFACEVNLL